MFSQPETFLAAHIRERGTLRGNEWAWPISEIPTVIEAARLAGAVNVGGQLQFRLPGGGTCELYWIEVDTLKAIPSDAPRQDRVEQTADVALSQFQDLQQRFDFLAEGQSAFGQHLDAITAAGGDPLDAMCFVWYFEARPEG
jgi:hypothetical protein